MTTLKFDDGLDITLKEHRKWEFCVPVGFTALPTIDHVAKALHPLMTGQEWTEGQYLSPDLSLLWHALDNMSAEEIRFFIVDKLNRNNM